MKNQPKFIYLQTGLEEYGEVCEDFNTLDSSSISWCADKIYEDDLQFISVSFISRQIEEIEEELKDEDSSFDRKILKIQIINKLISANVKFDDYNESSIINQFKNNSINKYSNLDSFKILKNELISNYRSLLKDNIYLIDALTIIKNIAFYGKYSKWLEEFILFKFGNENFRTNNSFEYYTDFSIRIQQITLYQNDDDFKSNFKLITFDNNKEIIINQLFNLKDGILNIDLSKFNELYNINVVSSEFFENFLQAFKFKSKDYINLNLEHKQET
jgi:hypothetical protein